MIDQQLKVADFLFCLKKTSETNRPNLMKFYKKVHACPFTKIKQGINIDQQQHGRLLFAFKKNCALKQLPRLNRFYFTVSYLT